MVICSLLFLLSYKVDSQSPCKGYKGQIVIGNPNATGKSGNKGILIFTPSTNNYQYVANNTFIYGLVFSNNKQEIIGFVDDHTIVEYDINSKKTTQIYRGDQLDASYTDLRYIPNSHNISFISDALYYLDRANHKIRLLEDTLAYDWI